MLRGLTEKNMAFEKRETEAVEVRMTVPCVIRAQREMKRDRGDGWDIKSKAGLLRHSYAIFCANNMVPSFP